MSSSSSSNSVTNKEDERTQTNLVNSINDFGFTLFKELVTQESDSASQGDNVFISPFSISQALEMVFAAATEGSSTQAELNHILKHDQYLSPSEQQNLFHTIKKLNHQLIESSSATELLIANFLWSNSSLNQQFFQEMTQQFQGELKPLQSEQEINKWCSEKTRGLISQVLDEIPPDTIAVLVNAIYFKGDWTEPFDPRDTYKTNFTTEIGHRQPINMMSCQRDSIPFYEDQLVQVAELSYGKDQQFSAIFVLPKDENTSLSNFVDNHFTMDNWNHWNRNFEDKKGTLEIPKTKITYGTKNLIPALKRMGLSSPFVSSGQLLRAFRDSAAVVEKVLHKAVLDIYEEGTEAAAVTVVMLAESATEDFEVPFHMRCDRPFLFGIKEKNTGQTLFMGKVSNPS
eukprot:gb/GECH01006048.1/.p1 GENE.gb/GECH01006048.1/~~gb/GECH01006048.1/.p1  ORF type:complete len:400 (+),score=112.13 gb/GECH01006048.1/:1-1200(+)